MCSTKDPKVLGRTGPTVKAGSSRTVARPMRSSLTVGVGSHRDVQRLPICIWAENYNGYRKVSRGVPRSSRSASPGASLFLDGGTRVHSGAVRSRTGLRTDGGTVGGAAAGRGGACGSVGQDRLQRA